MSSTTPIVTIFGGSGFVGRYIANRMARAGWRVRVAVRRPNEALFVRTYGAVGQVEPVLANVRDQASVERAVAGADVVVNCVGIVQERGRQKFAAIHIEAAERIAKAAVDAGAKKLVHISAMGAEADSDSTYLKSKAEGEAAVLAAFPDAVILRPSIMFGTEDRFFNRLAAIARLYRVVPVIGSKSRVQPVYVDDVAAAAQCALVGNMAGGVYELGGPDVETMLHLAKRMLQVTERKAVILRYPFWLARMNAWWFDMFSKATAGLYPAIISRDQVKMRALNYVIEEDAKGFAEFGMTPTSMDSILADYLYAFRPKGQYSAIEDSARNLKV